MCCTCVLSLKGMERTCVQPIRATFAVCCVCRAHCCLLFLCSRDVCTHPHVHTRNREELLLQPLDSHSPSYLQALYGHWAQHYTFVLAQSHTTNHTPGIQSLTSVLAQSHTTTHQAFSISPLRLHNRTQPTTHQAFSLSHLCLHNRTQPTTHQAFSLSFLWQSRGSTSQGTSEREEQTKEISTLRSTTDLSRRAPSDGPWLSSSAPPALPSSESSRRTSDSDEV
jgi:hypothetical protein